MDQRADDPSAAADNVAHEDVASVHSLSPLPQPPEGTSPGEGASAGASRPRRRRHRRPGDLTPGWSTVFGTAWLLVAVGFASVWVSARTTGLSTWWLGPETAPRFFLLWLLPFAAPLLLAASGYSQVRRLPIAGVVGAAVSALIALGDLGRVNGYAVVEFSLAGGGLLVSIAAFGGTYRVATVQPSGGDAATAA